MKLSTAFVALMTVARTAATSISSKTASKLVRNSRRVEDAEEEEEEFSFLGNYDVKLVGCKRELEQPLMNEEGEYEYSAVLLRLCPSSDGCDSSTVEGCSSGYGEMLVGLSTFVEAYFEDQEENQNDDGDDYFEVDKLAKCEEYNPDENADDANQGAWENYEFFVGPTCTEDELDIQVELFTDQYCTQVSEITFETISNGWTLPYSSGGLVSTYCNSCTEYNDDGEMEITEMCMKSYEEAGLKCEEDMEYYSYYGQNIQGCETIAEMFPKSSSGSGGKIFGWIVLAVVVVGLVGYIVWWRKKKASTIE
jgi:hypothetical protein